MRSAYHENWLLNLRMLKEAKRWAKSKFITNEQLAEIQKAYPVGFYHPNFIIRILLFMATLFALAGVSGLLAMVVSGNEEDTMSFISLVYGMVSIGVLEKKFIGENHHYKSGVNEALLYHSLGFMLGGIGGFVDFNNAQFLLWSAFVLTAFAGYRYLDLLCTTAALLIGSYLLFDGFYSLGGIMQQIIPFVFIVAFTPVYFLIRRLKQLVSSEPWSNNLLIVESYGLIIIYLAGNYLIVRELSIALMGLALEEGADIPFAFLFYGLTVLIPIVYLYQGIRAKDVVLLRVSLVVLAFSVFTFKFYYSTGHHEITFTVGGMLMIAASLLLFRYLKLPKNGYTRENILEEKWAGGQAEAFIISQTMGGNKVPTPDMPGGGTSGGGGSTDSF